MRIAESEWGSKIAQILLFYLPEDALCDSEKYPRRYGKRQSAGKNGDPETRVEGMFDAHPDGYNGNECDTGGYQTACDDEPP